MHRDNLIDAPAVADRADPVAMACQQARHDRDELDQQVALEHVDRAKVDRWAKVEQEPGADLAVLVVLAHIRRAHARRDVPVHIANVVFGLVLAHFGQVEAEAVEQGAVVALQDAIQAADDVPVQAL